MIKLSQHFEPESAPTKEVHFKNQNPLKRWIESLLKDHLFRIFNDYFEIIPAEDEESLNDALSLRYQSFCIDKGFEDKNRCEDGKERDIYDDAGRTKHTIVYFNDPISGNRIPVGTARIILPKALNWKAALPVQTICTEQNEEKIASLDELTKSVELSRLCIPKRIREIVVEQLKKEGKLLNCTINAITSLIPIAVIRGAFELAIEEKITDFYCIMTPALLSKLEDAGLVYDVLGSPIEHRGQRLPLHFNSTNTLQHAATNNPVGFMLISNDGQNLKDAKRIEEQRSLKASGNIEPATKTTDRTNYQLAVG